VTRYIALAKPPAAWVSDTHTPETLPTIVVHETDKAPVATGLVDAHGVPLYRQPENIRPGFVGKNGSAPR
jgi:hypothetical protein